MSIRAQQIAELEAQLALHRQTQEAHEALERDPNIQIESLVGDRWVQCDPAWHQNAHYRIKPTPKLRPWKPEEAIGKVVRNKKDRELTLIWRAVPKECSAYGPIPYSELLSDFEQLDGSPCGVMEP